jgi:hypothetical protein
VARLSEQATYRADKRAEALALSLSREDMEERLGPEALANFLGVELPSGDSSTTEDATAGSGCESEADDDGDGGDPGASGSESDSSGGEAPGPDEAPGVQGPRSCLPPNFSELPYGACLEAILAAVQERKTDRRATVGRKKWSKRDKFIAAAFYVLFAGKAPAYCSIKANYVSALLARERSYYSLQRYGKVPPSRDITPTEWVTELFQKWRGTLAQDTSEGACTIPVDEVSNHCFTIAGDGSAQRKGKPFSGHSGLVVIRDTDRKVMGMFAMMTELKKEDCFVPEAEAGIRAAVITKSLLSMGALSVTYIGDSYALWDQLASSSASTPAAALVRPIRDFVPKWREWYKPRRRTLNRFADFLTKVYPKEWDKWEDVDELPPADLLEEYVEELYFRRFDTTSTPPPKQCDLPRATKGEALEHGISFLAGLDEGELRYRNIPLSGLPGNMVRPNVMACMEEALTLRERAPRLPLLIARWLTGNIVTTRTVGRQKEMRRRCELYMLRDWEALHKRSAPQARSRRADAADEELRQKLVQNDVEWGRVGRARQRLISAGILDLKDQDVQDCIKAKYPAEETFTIEVEALQWTSKECIFQGRDGDVTTCSLEYVLDHKLPPGKAPGLSGMTYELIGAFCANPARRKLMCAYAHEVVNDQVPEEVREFYKAKLVVPLRKKEGSRDARPIGVGECIRRWAAIAMAVEETGHAGVWPASTEIDQLTNQFGVGVKAGAECVFRIAEAFASQNPDSVVAKADARNGFNSIKRSAIWAGLKALGMTRLERYFATFYTGESEIVDGCGIFDILQSMGVDQGDPLGPLLFAVGMWYLTREVVRDHPSVLFTFYIDDVFMHGKAPDVAAAFPALKKALAEGGLFLSTSAGKQEVWCPAEAKPEGFLDVCDVMGAAPDLEGLRVVGTPLGSKGYVTREVTSMVDQYVRELELLTPLAQSSPKHALHVWLKCTMPTLNFLMRGVSPVVLGKVEERVTQAERAFFLHIAGRPRLDDMPAEDAKRWKLASLPKTRGGLGIRDFASISAAAFFASWCDCLHAASRMSLDLGRLLAGSWRDYGRRSGLAYEGLSMARSLLTRPFSGCPELSGFDLGRTVEKLARFTDPDDPLPVQVGAAEEAVAEEDGGLNKAFLQRSLSRRVYQQDRQDLLSPVTPESYALQATIRSSIGGVVSNGWASAFDLSEFTPTTSAFSRGRRIISHSGFSAEEFRVAIQVRLHLTDPVLNEAALRFETVVCACGRVLSPSEWYHFLSCRCGGFSDRHDSIVRLLVIAARRSMPVRGDKQSAAFGVGGKSKQADMELSCNGVREAFDVRCISALSEKYRRHKIRRLYPISLGECDDLFHDFNPARDDLAATHISRFEKIAEYSTAHGVPTEASYMSLDLKKPLKPEERRHLKIIEIEDPPRQPVSFTPLLFQIGGAMTPESRTCLRDLAQAAAESLPGEDGVYKRFLTSLSISLSHRMMRAVARMVIRLRGAMLFGKRTHYSPPPDATGLNTLSSWTSRDVPFYEASRSLLCDAKAPAQPARFAPIKLGKVKVHRPPQGAHVSNLALASPSHSLTVE